MAGLLDFLAQMPVQQAADPRTQNWGLESLNNSLAGIAAQMEAEKERKRLLAAQELAAKEARLKASDEMVGRMAQAGMGDSAAAAYNQSNALRKELYGLSGPAIKGGAIPMSGADVLAMDATANPDVGLNAAGQPFRRDYNNPQTLGMLQTLSGVKPYVGTLAPGHMAYNKMTGQEVAHAPYAPRIVANSKYGNSLIDPNNPGAGMSAAVPGAAPAARGPMPVVPPAPVQPRSSGGGRRSSGGSGGGRGRSSRDRLQRITLDNGNIGILNLDTQEITDTGRAQYQKSASGGGKQPQQMTETQITNTAMDRVRKRDKWISGPAFDAAVETEKAKVRAEQPKPQQQRQKPTSKPGGGGKLDSILKRLEAL